MERHDQGDPVSWAVVISPNQEGHPTAHVWISIPLGLLGESRGGWSHISAIQAASDDDLVDNAILEGLERLRQERSAFLADPDGFRQTVEAQQAAQAASATNGGIPL
jgi:hypothetical protein